MALLAGAPVWFQRAARCRRHAGSASAARAGVVRGATQWHERLERHARDARGEAGGGARGHPTVNHAPSGTSTSSHAVRDARRVRRRAARRRSRPEPGRGRAGASSPPGRGARARVPRPRRAPRRLARRRAAGGRQGRGRARSPRRARRGRARPGPRRVPPHARSSSSTPTSGASAGSATACSWATSSLGLGLDLDRVFVCGLAEGTFPARVRDDSLLPDADRRATDGALRAARRRVSTTTTAACSPRSPARAGRACCSSPGATSAAPPSACRHASCSTRSRRSPAPRHYADDLRRLDADWFTPVPSFAAGIARVEFPATEQEHRLRALLDHTRARRCQSPTSRAPRRRRRARARPRLRARARRAARSPASTATSAASPVPSPAGGDAVVSPTRLETLGAFARSTTSWSTCCGSRSPSCPRRSTSCRRSTAAASCTRPSTTFLARGARPARRRRRHPARPGPTPIGPGCTRSPSAQCDRYEAQGLTGRRLFWDRDRRRILADLDRFLAEDSDAARRARPAPRSPPSCAFGLRDAERPAIEIALSDGRRAALPRRRRPRRRHAPAARCSVIDYKTGTSSVRSSTTAIPRRRARCCSSPCTRTRRGRRSATTDTPVGAAYWFVSTRGQFRWAELALDDADVDARFDDVLRAIVDGIEHGVFPCRARSARARGHARGAPTPTPTRAARATATASGCASAARRSCAATSRSPSPTSSTTSSRRARRRRSRSSGMTVVQRCS